MQDRPATVIDPVCGMTVEVARAEAEGRTLEHEGRIFAFCRPGCARAFQEEPEAYAAKATQAAVSAREQSAGSLGSTALPQIDEGMRRWYESCSCCLGDAYPEIKAQLDAERTAATQQPVAAGICEVAEGG